VTPRDRLLPEEIAQAPELLVLAQLETALWTLDIALVAAHPELLDELARPRDRPSLKAARLVCDRAHALRRSLERYRRLLETELAPPPDSDDLPF
jgi:hypothetical protein